MPIKIPKLYNKNDINKQNKPNATLIIINLSVVK